MAPGSAATSRNLPTTPRPIVLALYLVCVHIYNFYVGGPPGGGGGGADSKGPNDHQHARTARAHPAADTTTGGWTGK